MVQAIDLIIKIFGNNGIELIGSLLLATTIGLFYTKSNIKWGLKYLSFAFYALVFKNLILMGFHLYEVLNPGYQVPVPLYDWIDFSFICIASALFLASALSMLHLLFSPLPFAIITSGLLIGSGYLVSTTPKTTDLFTILPNIYIASAFLIIGLSLIMMQKAQKNALLVL